MLIFFKPATVAIIFLITYLVPSGRPSNFSGVNISSYDLLLHWSGIPYDEWRGIPLGYTILYRETDATGSTWNSSKVYGESAVSAVIGSLTAYTNHTLRIACFTIKGNGNFSADIVVSTAEDGRYKMLTTYFILLLYTIEQSVRIYTSKHVWHFN